MYSGMQTYYIIWNRNGLFILHYCKLFEHQQN
jgi:hypothetical protein